MILEVLLLFVTLLVFFYYKVTRNWNYWERKNIPTLKPSFPLGSVPSFFTRKQAFYDMFKELGQKTKDWPICGLYQLNSTLMVNDANLIKHILVKDFDYFTDRRGAESATTHALKKSTKTDQIWSIQMTNATGLLTSNYKLKIRLQLLMFLNAIQFQL